MSRWSVSIDEDRVDGSTSPGSSCRAARADLGDAQKRLAKPMIEVDAMERHTIICMWRLTIDWRIGKIQMGVIRGSHVKHDAELVNLSEGDLRDVLDDDVRITAEAAPGSPSRLGDPGQRGELAIGAHGAGEDGHRVPDELARVLKRAARRGGRLGPAGLPFPRIDERI